ncbi:hypothetical protein FRB99_004353, partial [Tulasnella sp. 403]
CMTGGVKACRHLPGERPARRRLRCKRSRLWMDPRMHATNPVTIFYFMFLLPRTRPNWRLARTVSRCSCFPAC